MIINVIFDEDVSMRLLLTNYDIDIPFGDSRHTLAVEFCSLFGQRSIFVLWLSYPMIAEGIS